MARLPTFEEQFVEWIDIDPTTLPEGLTMDMIFRAGREIAMSDIESKPVVTSNSAIKFYDNPKFLSNIIKTTKNIKNNATLQDHQWTIIPTNEECNFLTQFKIFREADGKATVIDLPVTPILQPQMCSYNAYYIHEHTKGVWDIVAGYTVLKNKSHEAYLLELHFVNVNVLTGEFIDYTSDATETVKKFVVCPALTAYTKALIRDMKNQLIPHWSIGANIIGFLQTTMKGRDYMYNVGNAIYVPDGKYPNGMNTLCNKKILKFPKFLKELKRFQQHLNISPRWGNDIP